MTGSSAPSTEPLRSLSGGDAIDKIIIVGSSSSSELSQLSTPPPTKKQSSPKKSESKKRPRQSEGTDAGKSKKKVKTDANAIEQEKQERGIYCHQLVFRLCSSVLTHRCRTRCEAESTWLPSIVASGELQLIPGVLRCTNLKRFSKNVERPCNLAFCDKCLAKRYNTKADSIRDGHDSAYQWTCPCCSNICQSSPCPYLLASCRRCS